MYDISPVNSLTIEQQFSYNQVQQLRHDIQKCKGNNRLLWNDLEKALDNYNQCFSSRSAKNGA